MPPASDRTPFTDWLRGHATPLSHLDPAAPPWTTWNRCATSSTVPGWSPWANTATSSTSSPPCAGASCGSPSNTAASPSSPSSTASAKPSPSTPGRRARARTTTSPHFWRLRSPSDSRRRRASSVGTTALPRHRSASRGSTSRSAGGSLLPALTPVADYLRRIDPETLPTVQSANTIAASFAGDSAAVAAPAWARLPTTDRDTLTAVLPAAFCHGPRPRRLVVGRLPVRHEGGDLARVVGEGVQLDGRQGSPSARWRSPGPAMGGEGG